MSVEAKIADLFGRRVVVLIDHDGARTKRWAKEAPYALVCNRWSWIFRPCWLLPDGSVLGPRYVHRWEYAEGATP